MGMFHFQICYYNDISETNVTMFYDREFQGFLLVMKLVRMKQKRDFWRRNNNKKGQEKNLFFFQEHSGVSSEIVIEKEFYLLP